MLLMMAGCGNGTTKKKETVTKDVSVGFPAFSTGNTLSFAPTYTPDGGWGEHFNSSDITYTVAVTGAGVNRTYGSADGWTANISEGYTDTNAYTFTQTFKMGNTVVGVQIIKVFVLGGVFATLLDASDVTLAPQSIPPVHLTLSKEVEQ